MTIFAVRMDGAERPVQLLLTWMELVVGARQIDPFVSAQNHLKYRVQRQPGFSAVLEKYAPHLPNVLELVADPHQPIAAPT